MDVLFVGLFYVGLGGLHSFVLGCLVFLPTPSGPGFLGFELAT